MELVKVVGANLRATRLQRGLSLSEVARRATIGKGTLSELEAGQRNPTLETLYALATVLDVPLGELLGSTDTPAPTASEPLVCRASDQQLSGQAVDVQLMDRTSHRGQRLEIYRLHVRAGSRYLSPAHSPRVVEQLLVHSGTMIVGPHHAPATLGPGDYVRFEADTDHLYAAPEGDVDATLVMHYLTSSPS